ncbi:MAG: hypothetical protein V5804_00535 [Mucilaginibacter sp.]|uniref:hypothetical protein n=1 Tax=Mucilaginibacter sp. TaxID=1882438 RepID=UPI0034E5DBB3
MAIESKYSIVVVFYIVLTGLIGCGRKGNSCADTTFTFQTGLKAYPDKDSIRIGDTIWYETTIPVSLADIASKQVIDYSGATNLGTVFSIQKLIGGSVADPGTVPAAGDFKYILVTGRDVTNSFFERNREYLFAEVNKQYLFKLGIVAQKKGIYFSAMDNPRNVYRNTDKCTKATYLINFENTKQHLYLYQDNRPGYKIEGVELTNTYCFKVY